MHRTKRDEATRNQVNFSLRLIKQALCDQVIWKEWRYSSTILDLDTRWRWVVSFTPWQLYPRGKRHWYPFGYDAVWDPVPVWTLWTCRDSNPDRPPRRYTDWTNPAPEVTGGWKELNCEKLRNAYSSPYNIKTPWPLVRKRTIPTERPPLSAKLVPTFAERGCRVVSETNPYGR
jgi:hypothetical protein